MNKAVFLDRDGTIIVDKGYSCNLDDITLIEGVASALLKLQDLGFLLIIITNQSGVARGFFTEEQLKQFNDELISLLERSGVHITAVYYCPHFTGGTISRYSLNCNCRKPKTALFFRAAAEYQIDLSKSFAIGDRERDCSICNESECRGFVISKDNTRKYGKHIQNVRCIQQCIDYIIKSENS